MEATQKWRATALVACAALTACSSDDQDGGGGGAQSSDRGGSASATGGGPGATGAGTAGTGATFAAGGEGSGVLGTGFDTSSGGEGGTTDREPRDACEPEEAQSCVGERYEGENVPLDIYVMFDQSCSMSCPAEMTGAGLCCQGDPNGRILAVRQAVGEFLRDPDSAGIGVGISYFGYHEAGFTSCDPAEYSAPAVPMGQLPGHAEAIIGSLERAEPTGETPTGAAIRGACTYASQWQLQRPGHVVVVLLVTDGFPEAPVTSQNGGCNPTIEDAVSAAALCSDRNPSLPIYVLGVGQRLDFLNQIAAAGGTGQAYLVEGGDVALSVLAALNDIRRVASVPCELQIPPPPEGEQTLNLSQVNLAYCDPSGQSETFYYVETPSGCDSEPNTWHYNDTDDPTQIVLCGTTCDRVTEPGGSLSVSVGCDTQVMIR